MRQLKRVEIQSLIDKTVGKLPGWKGKLMDKAGRITLVRSVLTAMPIYFLTIFSIKKWAAKRIDKIRRNFLWKGSEEVSSGHCLVKWKRAALPKELRDLVFLNYKHSVEHCI